MDWIGISVIVGLLALVIIQYTQLDLLGKIEQYTRHTADQASRIRIVAENPNQRRPKNDAERIAESIRKAHEKYGEENG